MTDKNETLDESAALTLGGELTIYRAAEVREILLDALVPRASVPIRLEIDLSTVEEIDGAGVQLLLAAHKTARQQGTRLNLIKHSPAVIEVFELFDLAGYFGDPVLIPAER
ncbi:anti-anti-sigma factor [Noviherbaspirillum humi]|uniref:Anti-anti-sigma factor n=1 Tax=Noviherbaspirillum humi TaxID=1688639 RepID=A0A239JXT4_9BURK|nr:STAS domain-containing protein [Noviherbaspirillum humi]SNT10796.1 anti-anti-sigma factor [Noviherbaspirillum humi]